MNRRFLKRLLTALQLNPGNLLSGGLLGLLLFFYIAGVYIFVTALGTLPFGVQPSQSLLPDGQDWDLYIVTMIVIALTFLPVSRWLNERVNDLVYIQDAQPYELIAALNQRLSTMNSPELTLLQVVEMTRERLRLDCVCLEIHAQDGAAPQRFSAGSPSDGNQPVVYPITYLDRQIGSLSVVGRVGKRPISIGDHGVFLDIARHLGIALHVAHLTSDLRRSRERLVSAREEERRRIRNDLHDDLAPMLSSFLMQLAAVRRLLDTDSEQAGEIIRELSADLRRATGDIRDLVYDLRPPLLDELGLVGAIRSLDLFGSPLSLKVAAPEPLPELPPAVEVAIFRIVKEALQNALVHGKAKNCTISLVVETGQLILIIVDDGRGLDASTKPGIGLQSMRERATELGGTFAIHALDPGTRIEVWLPLGK